MGKGIEGYQNAYKSSRLTSTPFGDVLVDTGKMAGLPFKDGSLQTVTISPTPFPLDELRRVAQIVRFTSDSEPKLDAKLLTLQDKLRTTDVPILTAATVGKTTMSRAHLSQASSYASLFIDEGKTTQIVDISQNLYQNEYERMETIAHSGQFIARNRLAQIAYKNASTLLRSKLHLDTVFQKTIRMLMSSLTHTPGKPISTFHYGVGNALCNELVENRITTTPVIHYVTDPHHIHPDYLTHKDVPFVYYFTFDEKTMKILIEKGVPPDHVFATGFPIHPLLAIPQTNDEIHERYQAAPKKKMVISVFSGGIGSNQNEMVDLASSLDFSKQQGIFYCGTNVDIQKKVISELSKRKVSVRYISNKSPHLFLEDKNEALVILGDRQDERLLSLSYEAINAAHVVCTKPSGDLGIEGLVAHKPIIALSSWGEHEEKIKKILQESGALVPLKNVKSISSLTLEKLGEIALKQQNPFAPDWKKRVSDALVEINR